MYLDVIVVYGVAWGVVETPAEAFPEYPVGHQYEGDQVDAGEPVGPSGALHWGDHGYISSQCDRHLAVNLAPSSVTQGRFAERVPTATLVQTAEWDRLIREYCASLDLVLDREPGWLALGSWG